MKLKISSLKELRIAGIPFFQIALGVSVLVLILLIVPQVMNMAKVSGETNEKKKILSDLDLGIKNFTALELDHNSLDGAYKDFIRRLPLQREFPVFLELFSKLARENGVKIIAMEPQKVIDDPTLFFVKIPVLIDAYAGYHELGKFINELEFSSKLIKIDKIKIINMDVGQNKQQVFLTVLTFCLKDFTNETNLR
ncbi:MAG: type 4a pilus biogenesis protein PilO [Candidatus Omnitrophica bacterium]|nr:type 4a pilus biogenesis protein PilO [Candidatus Omnitrophota bacterium]